MIRGSALSPAQEKSYIEHASITSTNSLRATLDLIIWRNTMDSIGKLIPSITSGSLEVIPALANINFDFTLWKVTAPKEFEAVGSALCTCRRDDAESGMLHTIARKLGALFETRIPRTPGLIKAYGTRASEIAQALSLDERGRKNYGVFASRAGPDVTSLWAAATSGTSAISIHLLACLLARIWDASEATSIWMEIVKSRKQEVLAEFDATNTAQLVTLSAAKQDLPRAQIAKWDDSARAWLRVADGVKRKQQTQLMLILDNVQAPVSEKTNTYESIIEAWSNSLTQMEALVQGISQQARSGDILLALSSWHLFPDLTVVEPSKTHVRQNDPVLRTGAVLTIGLQAPIVQKKGVHWSLPLACLRHYGAPVVAAGSLCSEVRSRLSLQELLQATLGSLLEGWGPAGVDTLRSLKWISFMYNLLLEGAELGYDKASMLTEGFAKHSWLALLSETARLYLLSAGVDRQHSNKLISLGRKHGNTFLGTPVEPCFGLLAQGRSMSMVANEEEQIRLLRKVAESIAKEMAKDNITKETEILIRYKHRLSDSEWVYEYATAIPNNISKKRRADGVLCSVHSHQRWLYSGNQTIGRLGSPLIDEYIKRYSKIGYRFSACPNLKDERMEMLERYTASGDMYRSAREGAPTTNNAMAFQEFERRKAILTETGELVTDRGEEAIEDLLPADVGICRYHYDKSCVSWYSFAFGSVEDAALFVTEKSKPFVDVIQTPERNANILYSIFEARLVDKYRVAHELERSLRYAKPDVDPHLKSLKAISTAAMLFRDFPYASVDVRILQRRLYDVSWIRTCISSQQAPEPVGVFLPNFVAGGNLLAPRPYHASGTPESLQPYELSKAQAFACLAMFESGQHDIDPSQLIDVMAMSSGNSLYISATLLVDPYNQPQPGDIRGVMGNVGRPGIAFLVPPKNPLIKEAATDDWSLIERNAFDGSLSEHFQSTSLHLSFTTAETALDVGFSGGQDLEVRILETLVSVYDGGTWIADLNVSNLTTAGELSRLPRCITQHPADHRPSSVTCIDNWFSLIDHLGIGVSLVRAHYNWEARLAASSISIALGSPTLILPGDVCLNCFDGFVSRYNRDSARWSSGNSGYDVLRPPSVVVDIVVGNFLHGSTSVCINSRATSGI
ncbi:MAG: hypothetical protein Q9182_002974 [Xanthomendoza sp. 2 TL-2023]